MKNSMSITEFADKIGVIPDTIRRWERSGKIKPNRTSGGHRRYTEEHVWQVLGKDPRRVAKRKVIYCRVSSAEQKADMEHQIVAMESFALGRGIITETITEIGHGISLSRPKLTALIHEIIAGEIDMLIVAHKDRVGRFGFDFVECIAREYGCEIVALDNHRLSPHNEVVSDLKLAIRVFSHRIEDLATFREPEDLWM